MIERDDRTPSPAARSLTHPADLEPEQVPARMSVEALVLATLLIAGLVVVGWLVSPWWYCAAVAVGGFVGFRLMDPGEPR